MYWSESLVLPVSALSDAFPLRGNSASLEVDFVQSRYELEEMRPKRKLKSEGLYVNPEAVTMPEYIRFERQARNHLRKIFLQKIR